MTCRRIALLVALCCCCRPILAAGGFLTIGSWNLQNFLVGNRFENSRFLFSYPMPEARKQRIRSLILEHQPDVLFLQEIGSAAFLLELQRDLSAEGLCYPHSSFSGVEGSRSGLAFLSRIAPAEVVFHDLSLRRGLQEVRFYQADFPLRLFHVHLKSRFSEDSDDPHARRLRQQELTHLSAALRRFLASDTRSRMLLLGDFNTPFTDVLMLPLQQHWRPVSLTDSSGDPHTYFHHSGSAEILDGFWVPAASPFNPSGSLFPSPKNCPSDHRLLLLHLRYPS